MSIHVIVNNMKGKIDIFNKFFHLFFKLAKFAKLKIIQFKKLAKGKIFFINLFISCFGQRTYIGTKGRFLLAL